MMPMARGHWTFGGTPRQPDYSVINEAAMRKLDWVFDYAAAKGMNIELILFGYDVEQGEGLWARRKDQEAWIDLLVKRYKDRPKLFMWTVANEFERYRDGRYVFEGSDIEWVKALAARIHCCANIGKPVWTSRTNISAACRSEPAPRRNPPAVAS